MVKKNNKRAANFSETEITNLIIIWGSFYTQGRFNIATSHDIIWREIAEEYNYETIPATDVEPAQRILRYNSTRSYDELKSKLSNLRAEYNREKNKIKSGASPSVWPHFDALHNILATRDYHSAIAFDSVAHRSAPVPQADVDSADLETSLNDEALEPDVSEGLLLPTSTQITAKECLQFNLQPQPSTSKALPGPAHVSPTNMKSCHAAQTSSPSPVGEKITVNQYRRRKAPQAEALQKFLENDKTYIEEIKRRRELDEEQAQREAALAEEEREFRRQNLEIQRNTQVLLSQLLAMTQHQGPRQNFVQTPGPSRQLPPSRILAPINTNKVNQTQQGNVENQNVDAPKPIIMTYDPVLKKYIAKLG